MEKAARYKFMQMIAFLLVMIIGAAMLAGCGGKSSAPDKQAGNGKFKIRIGADSAPFSFQFRVAKAKGLFDKYNIDAEIQNFSFGIDTVNALILDQVDSGEAMDYALATRLGKDSDLRIVSYIATPSLDGSSLYVVGDGIKSPADLTGKNIAAQKGTVNEYVWAQTFKKFGVDPKTVNMLYFSSNSEMIAAVQTGKADAIWVDKSNQSKIAEIANIKALGDYHLIDFEMKGYLTLKDQFIKAHPEAVGNFLKALNEASDYIAKNPQETAEIAYQDLKLPKADVLKTLETYTYHVRFSQADYDHLHNIVTWSVQNGLIKNSYAVQDYLSLDILKKTLPEAVTYKGK
jgi:NitT/TauT family transport system substrate-binding protein